MAKEYAVIERQMLLMQISLMLLFVEDTPSIFLNSLVYLPKGGSIPTEAMLSISVSLLVIGYKVSMFEKLRLLQKREEDIETFFKSLNEGQLKDTKLKIMHELQRSAAAKAARLAQSKGRSSARKILAARSELSIRDRSSGRKSSVLPSSPKVSNRTSIRGTKSSWKLGATSSATSVVPITGGSVRGRGLRKR